MEPITLSLETAKEVYETAKKIQQVYNVSRKMKTVAESEGTDQIVATKDLAQSTMSSKFKDDSSEKEQSENSNRNKKDETSSVKFIDTLDDSDKGIMSKNDANVLFVEHLPQKEISIDGYESEQHGNHNESTSNGFDTTDIEKIKDEFSISDKSEHSIDSNDVDQTEKYIERSSTFEEQTIDNFKLEQQRPEIEKELILGKEHDADVLRYNLEKVTGQNPENSNAHHLVGNDTPEAAKKLEEFGIDRNDPANGIFLPDSPDSELKGSVHGQGRHIKEYSEEVEQRFAGVTTREEALEVLQSLKEDLYSGVLPLHYDVEPNK